MGLRTGLEEERQNLEQLSIPNNLKWFELSSNQTKRGNDQVNM